MSTISECLKIYDQHLEKIATLQSEETIQLYFEILGSGNIKLHLSFENYFHTGSNKFTIASISKFGNSFLYNNFEYRCISSSTHDEICSHLWYSFLMQEFRDKNETLVEKQAKLSFSLIEIESFSSQESVKFLKSSHLNDNDSEQFCEILGRIFLKKISSNFVF